MVSFESDYICGAHPKVVEALEKANMEQLSGYGADPYCARAAEKIRAACACPDAQVSFLVGGTQTNQVIIDTMLRPWEGVVAAQTGHVAMHEAGAIEYSGHKVLTVPQHDGKLNAADAEALISGFYEDENHEHMVYPGMLYISQPTEYGTLYTKAELEELHDVCVRHSIPLFIDGARLGYGLASAQADFTLPDIARLCDVFYIGGTKVGAFCGEAVVFTHNNQPEHFVTQVKQHGALLAKGWVLGVQFDALFTDGLYFTISQHAIAQAKRLHDLFERHGYTFYMDSPTNQQFVVLDNHVYSRLAEHVVMSPWEHPDEDHIVVRLATSWSTSDEDLTELEKWL